MPRLLLVMPLAHPKMAAVGEVGEDGVVVVVAGEADVVVEEVIEGGIIMTVMPKRKEKESNRQQLRKAPRMPIRERRGDGLSSQMADLTLGYVGMLLLQQFKAARKPSWTMDLLLPHSRTNKRNVSNAYIPHLLTLFSAFQRVKQNKKD